MSLARRGEPYPSSIGDDVESSLLFKNITAFDSALKDAAQSPESTTRANQVVLTANNLVSEFNSLSTMISQERQRAEQDIAASVDALTRHSKKLKT